MKIDLTLTNPGLYSGLDVQELAGRLTLLTPPPDAIPIFVRILQQWRSIAKR